MLNIRMELGDAMEFGIGNSESGKLKQRAERKEKVKDRGSGLKDKGGRSKVKEERRKIKGKRVDWIITLNGLIELIGLNKLIRSRIYLRVGR